MSYWNFRVVKHKEKKNVIWYAIHEAYYNDNEKMPHSISEFPAGIIEEEIKNIKWVLDEMVKATKKPILNYEDF